MNSVSMNVTLNAFAEELASDPEKILAQLKQEKHTSKYGKGRKNKLLAESMVGLKKMAEKG